MVVESSDSKTVNVLKNGKPAGVASTLGRTLFMKKKMIIDVRTRFLVKNSAIQFGLKKDLAKLGQISLCLVVPSRELTLKTQQKSCHLHTFPAPCHPLTILRRCRSNPLPLWRFTEIGHTKGRDPSGNHSLIYSLKCQSQKNYSP
jgi:hypothetical protein